MPVSDTQPYKLERQWCVILRRIAGAVDCINETVGRVMSWLIPLMVLNTFAVAVLRYAFDLGWVWLQESYVWMHGAIIMIGVGYTLLHDGHVRVDIVYAALSAKGKAWVNLLGVILFLLPMVCVLLWVVSPYVHLSWSRLETSREAGGIPGLFILKSTMLVFCAALGMQGVSMGLRSILEIFDGAHDSDGSHPLKTAEPR